MSLSDIRKNLKKLQGMELLVGWDENNHYDDKTPVAAVARVHEYGAPAANIPARSFIRPTFDAKKDELDNLLAKGVKRVADGKINPKEMLLAVGHVIKADIQQAISAVREPPLAESTIRHRDAKGRSHQPLHDTGLMIASCHPVVLEGEK